MGVNARKLTLLSKGQHWQLCNNVPVFSDDQGRGWHAGTGVFNYLQGYFSRLPLYSNGTIFFRYISSITDDGQASPSNPQTVSVTWPRMALHTAQHEFGNLPTLEK